MGLIAPKEVCQFLTAFNQTARQENNNHHKEQAQCEVPALADEGVYDIYQKIYI